MGASDGRIGGTARKRWAPLLMWCMVMAVGIGGVAWHAGTAEGASLAWFVVPSPNPSAAFTSLQGVSCLSASDCTAVGYSGEGATTQTLVESWNGTVWSIVASPNPSGNPDSSFNGVSCLSATNCTAVGASGNGPFQGSLVESWNGSAWSIVASPNPSGATEAYLEGVSCLSATSCTAVGFSDNGTIDTTLVESWNGTAWSIMTSPNVSGATNSGFNGVSCLSTTNCTAVGYSDNGSTDQTLVESWNGTAWSIVASPDPTGSTGALQGVSCLSSSNCEAVGFWGHGSLVESWNGAAWSIVASPNPSGATEVHLQGVTCLNTTNCTAAGYSGAGSADQTLIESWNGTVWSIVASPNPSGNPNSYLEGISCLTTASSCTAVGNSGNNSTSTSQSLVEAQSAPTAPAIASAPSTTFTQGVSDNFTVTATGTPTPSITNTGALPAGVSFTDNGNGTASLSGTATVSGTYPITITASNGVSPSATQSFILTVNPAPSVTVSAVSPNSGPTTGGTAITITGTGFVTGAKVEIGQGSGSGPTAIAASSVKVVSPTEITAVTGGGAKAGTFSLYVITSGGTSAPNSGDNFTYKGTVPTVSKVSPNSGPTTGGTAITITGTGFVTGAKVEIGQGSGSGPTAIAASSVKVVSPTEITAVTGGGAKAGTFSLYVITSGGTSAPNSGDNFTYH